MIHSRALRYGLALVALLGLAAGLWLWLRDSSLARVRDVQITGITASEGAQVRAALEKAALDMTTLNVREDVLRAATAQFASVETVNARADFPHGLMIEVVERQPVAALSGTGKRRVPVTENGTLLRGVTADRDLPSLVVPRAPAGVRLTDRNALRALAVAGAAPSLLRTRSDQLEVDDRGVVVVLDQGPELIFGTAQDAQAKWVAAARVLAEISAAGATYLDLRIPGRVAAGGLAPIAPEGINPNPGVEAENSPTLDP
jgi:cell division protein FtsQ